MFAIVWQWKINQCGFKPDHCTIKRQNLFHEEQSIKGHEITCQLIDFQKLLIRSIGNFFIHKLSKYSTTRNIFKIKQERRLKRLITLDGLEIGIQHQIVNALEPSNQHHHPSPPPPPQKKKINK